jgi:hypothetical protein
MDRLMWDLVRQVKSWKPEAGNLGMHQGGMTPTRPSRVVGAVVGGAAQGPAPARERIESGARHLSSSAPHCWIRRCAGRPGNASRS